MSKYVVNATWDDVPHLSEREKEEMLSAYPSMERDARSKGLPSLGAGAIYPYPESEVLIDPMEIPVFWWRMYAMDVGWKKTACLWGALDRDTDILYLVDEYYRGHQEPAVHASAIRQRGEWIPGVIDPAAWGRSQRDGEQLLQEYLGLGLQLTPAKNAVNAGIFAVEKRLGAGKLKVFRTLQNWLFEYRLYRRDEKGRIVKENDHLMDCMRYMELSGVEVARQVPSGEWGNYGFPPVGGGVSEERGGYNVLDLRPRLLSSVAGRRR